MCCYSHGCGPLEAKPIKFLLTHTHTHIHRFTCVWAAQHTQPQGVWSIRVLGPCANTATLTVHQHVGSGLTFNQSTFNACGLFALFIDKISARVFGIMGNICHHLFPRQWTLEAANAALLQFSASSQTYFCLNYQYGSCCKVIHYP